MYPNPVKERVTLELNVSDAVLHTWQIFDVNGKVVMFGSNALSSGKNIIHLNTQPLETGIYCLKSNIDGMVKTSKIVKQ